MRSSHRQEFCVYFYCTILCENRPLFGSRTIHAPFYSRFHSFIIASFAFYPHNTHTAVSRTATASVTTTATHNIYKKSTKTTANKAVKSFAYAILGAIEFHRLNRICITCAAYLKEPSIRGLCHTGQNAKPAQANRL